MKIQLGGNNANPQHWLKLILIPTKLKPRWRKKKGKSKRKSEVQLYTSNHSSSNLYLLLCISLISLQYPISVFSP